MGNISESVLSGDTSNIILDWNDTVTMFRATTTIIAGAAGAREETWTSNLTTTADIQETPGRFRSQPKSTEGGFQFIPEKELFMRQGVDVAVNDRFTASDGHIYYVNLIVPSEDHTHVYTSRHPREA